RRILMLGDSFLENLEVDFHDVYHKILEQRLCQETGSDIEVVAIGSQGYSTAQELLAFRRYREVVAPDVVITIFYTGNDFEDNARKQFAYLNDDRKLCFSENRPSTWNVQKQTFKRWLYESSHLVFLLKNRIESWGGLTIEDPAKAIANDGEGYREQMTRQLLAAMRDEVQSSGVRFGVVVMPSRDELLAGDRRLIELAISYCREWGITHVDLSQGLRSEDYFEHDVHLTRDGHVKVAQLLRAFLLAEFPRELGTSSETSAAE
ncbi:MAG: SGNH/GDSL hydrolase family protein, partial [Planctomycetales bacterium]|nr:SGNH/GDSL hydrolase family protein [Planctomycetales bacterium]